MTQLRKLTPDQLRTILDQHRIHMESGRAEGEWADLSRADLRGVNLRGEDLRFATMDFACLQGADLTNAKLDGTRLTNADLTGAKGLTVGMLRKSRYLGAVVDPRLARYMGELVKVAVKPIRSSKHRNRLLSKASLGGPPQ